ncbi:hypothetical protein HBI23_199070 [Parastagonospora nodorum]|nr:hypothetical protein HBI47_127900 [Parastagonospora nodorum]KAH5641407.1 hypothetical protein HBI23_199070 [Parastagonospora nodorum]
MDIKNQEQIAIDTCISVVQVYFPCEESTPLNHTCLCEQYAWHVACHDNHASSRSSRINADTAMRKSCLAAGIIDLPTIQRNRHPERRQLGSFLNSLGGVAASFFSRESIALPIPTAIPSSPALTSAQTTTPAQTSRAPSATRTAQSSAPAPTTFASSVSPTVSQVSSDSAASQTAAASTSQSSKPSTGLIAGAAVGGIAVVILLAILITLCLRHKRKKREAPLPYKHSPMLDNASHRSLDETLVERTPMVEPRTPHYQQEVPIGGYVQNEKAAYKAGNKPLPVPAQVEMETSANVWELDATEKPRPIRVGLESPIIAHGQMRSERNERRRNHRDELHF